MMHWWEVIPSFVPLLQTLIWVGLIIGLAYILRNRLYPFLNVIEERLRLGSALKVGPGGLELGQLELLREVKPQPTTVSARDSSGESLSFVSALQDPSKLDSEGQWLTARQSIYDANREIFLSHVMTPTEQVDSKTNKRIYNVFVLLRRHMHDNLSGVKKAEFYLGRWWGNRVFEEYPVNGIIGFRLRAYGSILCLCRVTFDDGYQALLSHYIDVEIGTFAGVSH